MKRHRIKDLTTAKFAFVDQAAVPKAYFHFIKRGSSMDKGDFDKILKRLDALEAQVFGQESISDDQDAEVIKELDEVQKLYAENKLTDEEYLALLIEFESTVQL